MTSRLASLLVQENLVASKTMADAFQRQVIYGGTLDTILLEMNALPEPTLVAALGRASALPTAESLPARDELLAEDLLTLVSAETAASLRVVPHSLDGKTLRVLVLDPPDRRAVDQLAQELGRPVDALITPEHRFVHAMGHAYDVVVPARFQSLQARLAKRATQPSAARQPASLPTQPAPVTQAAKLAPKIVTDLPQAVPPPDSPIPQPHDEQLTPRLTTRQADAPARIAREIAEPTGAPSETTEPLAVHTAVKAIDEAIDRDAIFVALCRGARSLADFVALFTLHAGVATGRAALANRWTDASVLSALLLPLGGATPFRAAVDSRQAVLGLVGEDAASATLLARLGRRSPVGAAIAPIILRERVVAVLYADGGGRSLAPVVLSDFALLTNASSRAFQRLILAAKGRDYNAPPTGNMGAKLATSDVPGKAVGTEGWRSTQDARTPSSALHDAPTAKHIAPTSGDLEALFVSVERGDDLARLAGDQIVALGAGGAERIAARLPGPVRIDRVGLRGPTPLLEEHGPLLALLARIGPAALPTLEAKLDDANAAIRYYATLAVGEMGRGRQIALVGKQLFDRDSSVRKAAVDTLRRQKDSDERTTILESLRGELPGPDTDRQRWAAEALGHFGDVQSVPRLIELLKHDDETLRSAAHLALVHVTKQDFGTSRWRWRGWWDRNKTKSRIEWLFEGLSSSSDELRAASAQELRAQFPESFGYDWNAPKRDRDEAKRKWYEWHLSRSG